jgi:hypothetical protein
MRVPVPSVRGWRVGVRASRSADSTSVRFSSPSAIAQTRERNCWSPISHGSPSILRYPDGSVTADEVS